MTNQSTSTLNKVKKGLKKRHAAEMRFRLYGQIAIALSIAFLLTLFTSVVSKGYKAFQSTEIYLDVVIDAESLDLEMENGRYDPEELESADYAALIKAALRQKFPEVTERKAKRQLYSLVSANAEYKIRDQVIAKPDIIGATLPLWLLADDEVDMFLKGYIDRNLAEDERRVKDNQIVWIDQLLADKQLRTRFNTTFFTAGDSRNAESAGIWGAMKGSFYVLLVTLLLSFPLGVGAAIYLEEFAPRNRWTDFVEVNVNNLAAVPSIVFGLLGLAVFINFFGMPRSAPLVGGLVLTLMTLPTIIISSRAALKSVPPSIKEAALGVGASHMQAIFYHVLPLAMPGMLTGSIIGMAQALGESAPLLMIGMVAFIVDIPQGIYDSATVLPVQIYLWADSPERAFVEKTSAAIMVLLIFLIAMNAFAVILRKQFERRW